MNIEMIVQNTNDRKAYDISESVKSISFDTEIEDVAGKLQFDLILPDATAYISEGSPVSLKIDNNNVFWGYIFKIGKKNMNNMSITAYDQLRYLKYKDTYVLGNMSAADIFKKICSDKQLDHKVVNSSSHVLAARIEDNKTCAEMIQYALDKTLIDTGEWYFIRDNFGTLELLSVKEQQTDLALGDESLLNEYDFETSIDGDTYNQVKLVKENKETKKREIYIVKDSSTIKKWGLLQYFETIKENSNEAQIKERTEMLLRHYNKPKKTLKLDCIGDLRVKVGCGIVLLIKDLEKDTVYNKTAIVTKVTHEFENSSHKMNLEVKVV